MWSNTLDGRHSIRIDFSQLRTFELRVVGDIAMTEDYAIFAKLLLQLHTAQLAGVRVEIEKRNLRAKPQTVNELFTFDAKKEILTKAPFLRDCSQKARPRPTAPPVTMQTLSLSDIRDESVLANSIKMCNNLFPDSFRRQFHFSLFSAERENLPPFQSSSLRGNAFEEKSSSAQVGSRRSSLTVCFRRVYVRFCDDESCGKFSYLHNKPRGEVQPRLPEQHCVGDDEG